MVQVIIIIDTQIIVKIFQDIYLIILDVIIHQIKSMVYYIKVELIKKLEYIIRLVVIVLLNMVGVDEVTKYNKYIDKVNIYI